QIHWHQSRAHDDANTFRIAFGEIETAVAHGKDGRSDTESARPPHDLQTFAMLGRHEVVGIKIDNFTRNLDGMVGCIESTDRPNAAPSFDTRRPERLPADTIRSYHAHARDDDSAHG